jgi:DNA (cytosine-5)-methyltransferase 1
VERDGQVSVIETGKPVYRVPPMAEVRAMRATNGRRVISTFSGCGGSCLGFEMAGFEVLWASEFVSEARRCYQLNHLGVPVDGSDIRDISATDILTTVGLTVGELDVLEGSPPCASFSTAGKRHRGWGLVSDYSDTRQRSDDLFWEFARLLSGIQPKVFIAENVSGIVKGVAKGYFKRILTELRRQGYRVEARLLDAQWLGVPQARQRVIFMGVRDDLAIAHRWPSPLPYRYTIADALGWVSSADTYVEQARADVTTPIETIALAAYDTRGQFTKVDFTTSVAPTVVANGQAHFALHGRDLQTIDPETGTSILLKDTAIGREWDRLRPGRSSERYFNLVRPLSDQPCPTITQLAGQIGVAGVTHPTQRRKFTLGELRRICSFPDDFELTGSYSQRWERLGRAVPPLMMRAVAQCVAEMLGAP